MGNQLTKNRGNSSPSTGSVNSTNRFTISTPPRSTRNNNNNTSSRSVTTIVRGEFNVAIEEHHHEFNDDDDNYSGNDDEVRTSKRNDNARSRKARAADTPVSSTKKPQAKRKNYEQSNNNEPKKRKFSQTKLDFVPSPVRSKNASGITPNAAVASKVNTARASTIKTNTGKLIKNQSTSIKVSKLDATIDFSDETDDDNRKPSARSCLQKSDDERKPTARPISQKSDDDGKPAARPAVLHKSDDKRNNTDVKRIRSNVKTESSEAQQQPSSSDKNATASSFERKPEFQRIYKIVKELYKQRMDADLNYKEDKFKILMDTNSSIDSNGLIDVTKEPNRDDDMDTEPLHPLFSESSVVSNNVIRIERDVTSQNQKQFKITHHFTRPPSKQQQQSTTLSVKCPKIMLQHNNKNKDNYFTKNKFSVHLHSSYAVEDEAVLNYVPFLDESATNNERLGELLQDYNFEERLKDIAFGGNTMIREYITKHMKGIMKEIFYKKNPEFRQNKQYKMYVFYALEKFFKLSDVMDKIEEQYNEVGRECSDSAVSRETDVNPSDVASGRPFPPRKGRQGVMHGSVIKNESDPPGKVNKAKREIDDEEDSSIDNDNDRPSNRKLSRKRNSNIIKNKIVDSDSDYCIVIDDSNEEEDTSSSDGCVIIDDMNRHLDTYEKSVSTYRILWCRRCFQMDCNIHGIFHKADLKTQYDINMQRDPTSSLCAKWNMNTNGVAGRHAFWKKADALFHEKLNEINQSLVMSLSLPTATSIRETMQPNNQETNDLTTFQKSIIGRVYQIYEGDVGRIAKILRASVPMVQKYITLHPSEFPTSPVKLKTKLPVRNRKIPYYSTRNYRHSIYEANSKTGIAPFCSPCCHQGACSSNNCDCISNRLFCTFACTINSDSKNFFRGCDCAGNCSTVRCTCYLANRECDPDLCVCVTCIDPPYQVEVKKQKCCNDRIYMNRAHPVLIGKSSIAGLGLFNKFDLKKGDYVGEYLGEKITQEEADRRGQCYDALKLSYMFTLASDVTLDAMRKGNKIRFINHSETPNLDVKTVFVRGEQRIGFYARYDIKAQSELFFDYQYNKQMSNDFIEKAAFKFEWMNDTHNATDECKLPDNQGTERTTAQAKKKPAPKKKKTKAKSAKVKKTSSKSKMQGGTKTTHK